MIDRIQLIRHIGQFDSVSAGGQIPLTKLTLVYAENGRGKTTLAAILRSLATGNPVPILERQRLAAANSPHVVISTTGGSRSVFQNGEWSEHLSDIAVFDDLFVAENVHSGLSVDTNQRQNLHELILGAEGVALNQALQTYVGRIEEHNRSLRTRADAIPAAVRGALTVDAFCALKERSDIDPAIQEAERNLAAAQSADAVRTRESFERIFLPEFDTDSIAGLLQLSLSDVEATAVARVQVHLAKLGTGSEAWIAEGMRRTAAVTEANGQELCPFCTQDLHTSSLIEHYREYFSTAYEELKQRIARELVNFRSKHSGEVVAAFERSVRVVIELRQFWSQFVEIPEVTLDTAAIARAWKVAQEKLLQILQQKQAAPLERSALPAEVEAAVAAYNRLRDQATSLGGQLMAINAQIAIVKERAAAANAAALATDLAQLQAIQQRYRPEIATLCDDYLNEKGAKAITERLRDQARVALDEYRTIIFPEYELAINNYLLRFNAGFRLTQVSSVNTRGGSACSYSVLINTVPVPLASGNTPGPSFRNTLSAGDRNALALAFFFASLDRDPNRVQKIVVIDDPITSLDEHRALTTVQEMRRLVDTVDQVIVLSHSKTFLCSIWQGADTATRSAIKIDRDGTGSTLSVWDINQDCVTEHDRRCRLVRDYLRSSSGADERAVAAALRPILEAFMRVAYSDVFVPGMLLGPFIGICEQRVYTVDRILTEDDISELRNLLDYANRFHHDTNPAWQTATINDAELTHFCQQVIAFARR